MALNAYARLTINGESLQGDTAVQTMGGVDVSSDHIEVYELRWGSAVPAAASGGRTGRVEMSPVLITKRIDHATPRLYQALVTNSQVEGDIKIFDTDPNDGTTRHRFTLVLGRGRLLSMTSSSPDTMDPAFSARPPREVAAIVATSLTYRDEIYSVEYEQEAIVR